VTGADAEAIIGHLGLVRHPEGGWYREGYRDAPADGSRGRLAHIFFLLKAGEVSRWHRVDVLEIWHYSSGAPLTLSIASPGAPIRHHVLGSNLLQGEAPHVIVPANAWQTARSRGAFTLVGCSTVPAFQYDGFELAAEGWEPPDR
jgi:predicted cupin superfamily sugar epimerase